MKSRKNDKYITNRKNDKYITNEQYAYYIYSLLVVFTHFEGGGPKLSLQENHEIKINL